MHTRREYGDPWCDGVVTREIKYRAMVFREAISSHQRKLVRRANKRAVIARAFAGTVCVTSRILRVVHRHTLYAYTLVDALNAHEE